VHTFSSSPVNWNTCLQSTNYSRFYGLSSSSFVAVTADGWRDAGILCKASQRFLCCVFYPNPYFVYFFCKHVAFCCRLLSTSDPVHRTFSLSSWIPLGLELCSWEICNEIFPDIFYGNHISYSLRLVQRNTLFNS
jgi:hypothetical protein